LYRTVKLVIIEGQIRIPLRYPVADQVMDLDADLCVCMSCTPNSITLSSSQTWYPTCCRQVWAISSLDMLR